MRSTRSSSHSPATGSASSAALTTRQAGSNTTGAPTGPSPALSGPPTLRSLRQSGGGRYTDSQGTFRDPAGGLASAVQGFPPYAPASTTASAGPRDEDLYPVPQSHRSGSWVRSFGMGGRSTGSAPTPATASTSSMPGRDQDLHPVPPQQSVASNVTRKVGSWLADFSTPSRRTGTASVAVAPTLAQGLPERQEETLTQVDSPLLDRSSLASFAISGHIRGGSGAQSGQSAGVELYLQQLEQPPVAVRSESSGAPRSALRQPGSSGKTVVWRDDPLTASQRIEPGSRGRTVPSVLSRALLEDDPAWAPSRDEEPRRQYLPQFMDNMSINTSLRENERTTLGLEEYLSEERYPDMLDEASQAAMSAAAGSSMTGREIDRHRQEVIERERDKDSSRSGGGTRS